ncbi:MAG: PIG-L family deacetylase [Chloroflexia bacterium]|nr:PIG-L family deacetylase [Chloroflexia bacterium]
MMRTDAAVEERVLLIFAHPDDESFGSAGLLAMLDDRDLPVVLLLATRGEAGEISSPDVGTPETLGPVREREVRQAMAIVGINDVRFLGYRDSGMAGTPENDDPRALVNAPDAELVAHLIGQIRDVRPTTVVTFGADGIYGHPDHVRIHHATMAAVRRAADDGTLAGLGEPWRIGALYFSAAPRERMLEWHELPNTPFHDMPREQVAKLGTPMSEITHWLDIRPYADRKRRVLASHRSQVGVNGPMADLPPEMTERFLATEQLRRAPLPWDSNNVATRIIDRLASDNPTEPPAAT